MRSFLLLVFLILRWKDFERANVKRIVTLILPLITEIDQINHIIVMLTNSQGKNISEINVRCSEYIKQHR